MPIIIGSLLMSLEFSVQLDSTHPQITRRNNASMGKRRPGRDTKDELGIRSEERISIEFMKRSRGFTLVEMAVVVVIVAALLTLGLSALNAQLSSASYTTTKQRQSAIKDALIGYLGANKRLPCPYVPVAGTPIAGTDTTTPPGTPSITPRCASFGIVPFATLGIVREIGQDGWGNFFSYRVYFETSPSCFGTGKDWGNSNCFGAGKNGGISVLDNTGGNNPPLPLTTNAVAVIISQGPNGLGAWAAQASKNALPVSCEELTNANLPGGCPTPAGVTPPYYFKGERQVQDDVVAWIDATEAINALSKQGVIKAAIAQVNDDLQVIYDDKLGLKLSKIISLGGSACSYDVLQPTVPVPPYDPWGKQYQVVLPSTGPTASTPLSICSPGCPTCTCRTINMNTLNGYLAKQGLPGC